MFKTKPKIPHVCGEENHSFEPRYNYGEAADLETRGQMRPESARGIIEVAKRTEYIYDICIHCGKTVSFIH